MESIEGLQQAFGEPRRQHFLGTIRYFSRNINFLVRSFFPILAGLALSDEFRQYIEVIAVVVFALHVFCIAVVLFCIAFLFALQFFAFEFLA